MAGKIDSPIFSSATEAPTQDSRFLFSIEARTWSVLLALQILREARTLPMAPMVVSASIGVLGPLVGKLAGLLAGEYGRLRGVRREILALQCELSSMHAAVQKYAMLQDPDIQVKQWISMVRELAYDIEDSIDKFIHRLGNGGRHGGFKEFFRKVTRGLKTLAPRHGIAGKIEHLNARIKQVKELKNSYKLDDAATGSTSNHTAVDPRLSALFAEEEHLVGIDGPRDDLVKWMVDQGNSSSQHRRVLSIVGFGGLGKTTLANEICRKIKGHFNCRAFVSVSQRPDIGKIIKDVISQVSCQDGAIESTTDHWDERKSITKLRELLKDKRYLIIIDDIWSTQAWNNIECAFPLNNHSSRIIATTRIVDVAKSCCSGTDDLKYEMEALSDIHSRQLFSKRIFGSNGSCTGTMKEVSAKVLKKCGGLPLAIISISGLLANKLVDKEVWEIVNRSIGSAMENNHSLEGMCSILSLSYNDLPPNLKTCLMYLSVFPEDFVIDRERLVRRWIAEGFISEERGRSQYQVAVGCFYELMNKSMIQPAHITLDGGVHGCKVHDTLLEIIITKSREDNFITVVGGGQTNLSKHGIIRRLSVQYINRELASALANADLSHVRSLTVTASDCIKHLPNLVEFEALRVLDFEGCKGVEQYDMKSVDKLFNLKYIGLKHTDISRLPSQIVTLSELETLDFQYTLVQELPAGFAKLTKLQYMFSTDGRKMTIPVGIGNMRNLRVISGFNATSSHGDALEELGNLTSLYYISVYLDCAGSECGGPDVYRTHEEKLFSSLRKLIGSHNLRVLFIQSADSHSLECLESWSPMKSSLYLFHMYTDYCFMKVPNWIGPSLASLSNLGINLTELTEGDLQSLGELPSLRELSLSLKTVQDMITVQGIGFASLQTFEIYSNKGTCITFVIGAMPRLEKLELNIDVSSKRNNGFYLGIVHLPCLERVSVRVKRWDATDSEIKTVVAGMKEEETAHTNHPTVSISYKGRDGRSHILK